MLREDIAYSSTRESVHATPALARLGCSDCLPLSMFPPFHAQAELGLSWIGADDNKNGQIIKTHTDGK